MTKLEWTPPSGGWQRLAGQGERYGLMALVWTLFYQQNVTKAWMALLLILLILGLARRWKGGEGWGMDSLWGFCLIALPLSMFITTQVMAPEFRMEWLRHFLLPLLAAPLIAGAFASPRDMERLTRAFAWSGVLLAAIDLHQYYQEYLDLGRISVDIPLHRRYGDGLVVVLPFALARAASSQHPVLRTGWFSLVGVEIVLLLLTGMRGAWLAAAASIALIALFVGFARVWAGLAVIAAAGYLAIKLAPPELVMARVVRGLDTTSRTESTWGPAVELALQRPFSGHGFADALFHQAYAVLKPDRPEWKLAVSEGPHSTYLAMLFFGGLMALGLYLILLFGLMAAILMRLWNDVMSTDYTRFRHAAHGLAITAALLAAYGVHGITETKSWPAFGVLVGAGMAWLAAHARLPRHGDEFQPQRTAYQGLGLTAAWGGVAGEAGQPERLALRLGDGVWLPLPAALSGPVADALRRRDGGAPD